MKRLSLVALTLGMPLAVLAQTVYTDDFTTDGSLATPPWYNISSSTTASAALNPGVGLALTVSSGTGRDQQEVAQFSGTPITLASVGDYLTFTVHFSGTGMAADTGGLLVGLLNTQGTPANANEVTTATGGATANDTGYFGIMGYNTTAGTSTKFYTRQGGVAAANELGYYSKMTAGTFVQITGASFPAAGNAILADSTAYTLSYTILNNGVSGNVITAVIKNGANTTLDSWTSTDNSGVGGAGLYNSFDEIAFGNYGKAGPVNLNITQVQVTDLIQPVPEPATFALAGLGMLGLVMVRRARR